MPKTIGIVGLGLIGGSMALALRRCPEYRVLGYNRNPQTLETALERQAIDGVFDLDSRREAELVILALPPDALLEFLNRYAGEFREGAVITDVCGVKTPITRPCSDICARHGLQFVGGHPMAGKEKSGFSAADPMLFSGASYILTPLEDTPLPAVEAVGALATALGCATLTVTSPEHHDEMIACTSQLPHLLANAYVRSPFASQHMGFSAGSFRDVSRVSTVDEHLWSQLMTLNAGPLTAEVERLIGHLREYCAWIAAGDKTGLAAALKQGRLAGEQIPK